MPQFLPRSATMQSKIMMFIDGENLAIRYAALLAGKSPESHVVYEPDVYVWSKYASRLTDPHEYIRRYYYTSIAGDENKRISIEQALRSAGIESPRVFRKEKGKRSKRVDIMLATEMLSHAHRKNYDIAVLVVGDEDYVPLVECVKSEGARVALWFVNNGLSDALLRSSDHFYDLGDILFRNENEPAFKMIYA